MNLVINGITVHPGDTVDFGEKGLLLFFDGEEAEAHRLLIKAHQKKIIKVIEFTKGKYNVGK